MFNLLSGRLVHEGRTSNEQLLSAMTQPAATLASAVSDVGAAVAHVVDRALAFDKADRWRDARRMQEAVRRAYHDRNHAPITTAPRLTVPETVPDRTLSVAERPPGGWSPTTGRPVVGTLLHWATLIRSAHPSRTVVGIASAVTLGIAITVIALASGHRSPAARLSPSAVPSVAPIVAPIVPPIASPSVVVEAATTPPAAPVIAATDLPSTPAEKPKPAAPVKASPAGTAPPAKPSCNPPYILEPSGKKKWKPECL